MSDDRHCPTHEEPMHALSHGVGALAAAVAAGVMLTIAYPHPDVWRLVSAGVFGGALVMLLTSSTLYHAAPPGPWKDRLQTVDHASIFGFIAASYTPVSLLVLKGTSSALLLVLQWGLAAVGVTLKAVHGPLAARTVSLGLYLLMGTMAVPFGVAIFAQMPVWASILFMVGGLSYLVGFAFYLVESVPWNHLWWHVAVLLGAGCHVLAVAGWLLPA